MAGDSIDDAIQKLESTSNKQRTEGLADLRRTLSRIQSTTRIRELREYGWHKILDTLFALVKGDRHDLLSGSASAKKRAASRLQDAAQALRLVVSFCTPYLRHKTAYAVLDHVNDSLDFENSNEEQVRNLIVGEYLKISHLILTDDSHGEHLRAKDWTRYADFVLTAINATLIDSSFTPDEDDDGDDHILASRDFSFSASARSVLPARPSQNMSSSTPSRQHALPLDDLIIYLMNLSSISNCPLAGKLEEIAQTILKVLSMPLRAKDVAFRCLNNVLIVAMTENTSLMFKITSQVVLLIKNFWLRTSKDDQKSTRLREQMLISLLLVRQALRKDVLVQAEIDAAAVEALARTMRDEYEKRNEPNRLQISDLVFTDAQEDHIFKRGGIAPNLDMHSAALNWLTVAMTAMLQAACGHQFVYREDGGDDGTISRKRQKRSIPFVDLVCWLMLDVRSIEFAQVADGLETLLAEASEDQTNKPSWVMLVLARLSRTSSARAEKMQGFWVQVWTTASQFITSPSNSRAACFTMMTLLQGGYVDTLLMQSQLTDFCFHGGTRGPPAMIDTAISLFSACLRSSSLESERLFDVFRDKVLSWLDIVWSLPTTRDHSLNVEVAQMGQSAPLFDLFRSLLSLPKMHGEKHWTFSTPAIYQAYLQSKDSESLATFVARSVKKESGEMQQKPTPNSQMVYSVRRKKQSYPVVSDFLLQKLENFRQAFRKIEFADSKQGSGEHTASRALVNLSSEMVEILATAVTVAILVIEPVTNSKGREIILQCWRCVSDFLSLHRRDTAEFEICFLRAARRVIEVWPTSRSDHLEVTQRRLQLVESLQQLASKNVAEHHSDNDMDAEFSIQASGSQPSQAKSQHLERDVARRDVPFSTSIHGLFTQASILLLQESLDIDLANSTNLASAMVDHAITLSPDDLLSSRAPLLNYLKDSSALSVADATRLLRHIAKLYLEADEFERNEAALCYCLKLMTSLAHLWVNTDDEELGDIAFDIYSWFVDVALGKGIASNKVLFNISELLDCLLKYQSRYGADSLPSPRTNLLQILKKGPSILKFQIVPSLMNLFEGYVLTEHAAIFDDIVDRLPTEPGDRDGISVRLYVLAKLGSRWTTVLRQAVYHIFETVANVPVATSVARSSLDMVTDELGTNESPGQLLHLFAPQIFYTWLEEGSISTIPFVAFGYKTLSDLIYAEQAELVAQAVLRQNPAHKRALEDLLQRPWHDILEENFARAQVYAIATDMIENRAGAGVGPVENSIQDDLGIDVYRSLANNYLADAVSLMIISTVDDRGLEKLFASSNRYKDLATRFEGMRERGHSSVTYPPRQQPSFRAKSLLQILTKLCQAAGVSIESLWTPAVLTYVCRKILDDADSALGPLHVASIVRKIRITVTLAGTAALEGFPLEMLLRALMPSLTHFHSSEDAVGVCWYLLEFGSDYLESNLTFLAGYGVSVLTSLSVFVTSSQESTTQESQFVSTMTKARNFRNWLGNYLIEMPSANTNDIHTENLQTIFQYAKSTTKHGSNDKNEPEGLLLYRLLLDRASSEPLISRKFFETILRTLSSDFEIGADELDDVLSHKDDIVRCVPSLWNAVLNVKTSGTFRVWAGKTLGKAYNLSGPLLSLADENSDLSINEYDPSLQPEHSSRAIVAILADLIWSENPTIAGRAEESLSFVLGSLSKQDRQTMLTIKRSWNSLEDLVFESIPHPPSHLLGSVPSATTSGSLDIKAHTDHQHWASSVAETIISQSTSDSFLQGLVPILRSSPSFGEQAMPMIVHLVLLAQMDEQRTSCETLSELFNGIFEDESEQSVPFIKVALKVVLYLRRCVHPLEKNLAERNSWLEINFNVASRAALHSRLPQTALMMLEISNSRQQLHPASRRSSIRAAQSSPPLDHELLSDIFDKVDDEDFFYGSHQESDVKSVLAKLRHENQGSKVLALQSALFDSAMKSAGFEDSVKQQGDGIVSALSLANLHGLAYAIQQQTGGSIDSRKEERLDESLLNTNQWDLPSIVTDSNEHQRALQSVLQKVEVFENENDLQVSINAGVTSMMENLFKQYACGKVSASHLLNLAALSAAEQLLVAPRTGSMAEMWNTLKQPEHWIGQESFTAISKILMTREATCAAMRRNDRASELFRSSPAELLLSEINSVRNSLLIARTQDATQFCLNRAVYLSDLHKTVQSLDLNVNAAILYDVANTLWSQGEVSAPIEILKTLKQSKTSSKEALPISRSEILTDLGQKLSEARLYRPDEITKHYLQPAIDALEKDASGAMTGRAYHNFAAFCDEQLRDSVAKDDFERISKIRNRKYQEVTELAELCKRSSGRERESFKMAYSKAKTWFKLDDEEYRRLKINRDLLLRHCLENYLLSIQACDDYGKDVLRFLSLWLGNPKVQAEESSIRDYLRMVPSLKLAPFVNQLSSRLADSGDPFQKTLFEMLFRICRDHPFHSLYQLFSVFKSKGAREDEAAKLRQKAADRLAKLIQSPDGKSSSQVWISVHNSNITFVNFAQEKSEKTTKTGKEIPIRSFTYGRKLEQTIQGLSKKIPPPTMKIALRRDKDYSSLPTFSTFEPNIAVAGGVSAPKITTIVASDGTRHKMLLKGGNDDLRQDAIMEQVFEQVSDLLKDHRPTRQRKLGIRTYKVIPLTHNAGIIEFVRNTIPLHDYLLPAHLLYHPKDYKPNYCRQQIANAQTKSTKERIKVFEDVIAHFHPVMRFFFMEHFLDPDEWFHKRLAYSRSTAAISILGHVLGLGDRHGHNILLDKHSGEVVHIDLGVAFEAGRVLHVPEVVPFRLTRDLVDGMGLSGVEGPFRRCCNFTLEALRKNQDVIMTILDVLRWDPLYSWSVSPLRVQRMQDAQEREAAAAAAAAAALNGSTNGDETLAADATGAGTSISNAAAQPTTRSKKDAEDGKGNANTNEPGEADRALSVVAKKLSAGLSVEATVNELIRQATDVDNLAVLYCGWAAYV